LNNHKTHIIKNAWIKPSIFTFEIFYSFRKLSAGFVSDILTVW